MRAITSFATTLVVSLVLAGCGGGGGGDDSSQLDKYVGTWVGCSQGERMTVTFNKTTNSSLSVGLVLDYFVDPNCAGASVGTATFSPPLSTLNYQKTESILVEDPLTYAVQMLGQHTADIFELISPGGTITLTGSGVVGNTVLRFTLQPTFPAGSRQTALNLTGGKLTPINFINATDVGGGRRVGNWYADEITWTKVN